MATLATMRNTLSKPEAGSTPVFHRPMLIPHLKVRVQIDPSGEHYPCGQQESLLKGMLRLGKRGIPAGCVSGGCGVCKVRILEGEVGQLGPISRAHVTEQEEALGYTLACRVSPKSDVRIRVCARLSKPFARPDEPA